MEYVDGDSNNSISLPSTFTPFLDFMGDAETTKLLTYGVAIHKNQQHQLSDTLINSKHA